MHQLTPKWSNIIITLPLSCTCIHIMDLLKSKQSSQTFLLAQDVLYQLVTYMLEERVVCIPLCYFSQLMSKAQHNQ